MMSLRREIAPLWHQRLIRTRERTTEEIEEAEKFVVVFKHLPVDIQRLIAEFVPSVFEMVSLSGRILKMRMSFSQADIDARLKFEKLPKKSSEYQNNLLKPERKLGFLPEHHPSTLVRHKRSYLFVDHLVMK